MNTISIVLWFFIAFVAVLVAFTLRKEDEEMPRREILRAVESSGSMGLAERSFLWVFSGLTRASASKTTGTCRSPRTTTCTARCP